MAEADYTPMVFATHKALESADVGKGVTAALTVPNGGGAIVLGFNALTTVQGFAGYFYSGDAAFAPIAGNKGGTIAAALRKYNGVTQYAPLIAFVSGTDITVADAYILGLSNDVPYQILLVKGKLASGLDPASTTVLRASDASFSDLTAWIDLRLDVLVNPHGETVLNVYQNDLANPVTARSWAVIPGMASYVDDSLGISSGSPPLVSGFRPAIGMWTGAIAGGVGLIDHVEISRQQNP